MNILHLITSLKVGGAESALVNYLSKIADNKYIGKDGNTHSVAYFHAGPNVDKIRDLGIKTYQVYGAFSIYDPVFFSRLFKLIKLIKPDVIHSSLWAANISARLISKSFKIPVICDLHGNSFDEGKFRNWLDRKTVHFCAKLVAVSDSVKESYSKNIIGAVKKKQVILQDKLTVIKNGIDVELVIKKAYLEPLKREDFGLLERDFVVGAVGRLEPIKSYDVLVKAFACFLNINSSVNIQQVSTQHLNAKLLIVGDGSQKKSLHDLVKTLKIEERVVFAGFRYDAYKFYPIFDCFALSSQSEGLSIALLEAMALRLPVISTNSDIKNHDVIKPEINGFLVAPYHIEGYASAINKLFQYHREDCRVSQAIGECNFTRVKTEFCINEVVSRYHKLYQDVAKNDFSKKL